MYKKLMACGLLALAAAAQAADVGVSVQVSQPGVYGRIDIGRFPQPAVVVAQPVVVTRPVVVHQPVAVAAPQPMYLWVPPGHRKKWHKHCHKYGACGAPVYFVQDQWYQQHVMAGHPRPVMHQDDHRGKGHRHGHKHGRGHDKD